MPSFFFYADESYNQEKFCLTAIAIGHGVWRECFDLAQEHRRLLNSDHGIFMRKEIHASDFVSGRGKISNTIIGKHERSRIFLGLLNLIAQMPVRLFNVCLDVKGNADPQMLAWDRMLNRIERTMLEWESKETLKRKNLLALLPPAFPDNEKKELGDRLLRYRPRALIFADEGRELEITRAIRKMHKFNPIPSNRGGWPEGKTRNITIERVLEDPIFRKSQDSIFIQLADCAAFALLKRESALTTNIEKYKVHTFFDQSLAKICCKQNSRTDPLGIVRN